MSEKVGSGFSQAAMPCRPRGPIEFEANWRRCMEQRRLHSGSIMVAALGDFEVLIGTLALDPVDQAILLRDPARPPALQIALQRFWLTHALEGGALAFFDEVVHPLEGLAVCTLPVKVVLPSMIRPKGFTRRVHAPRDRAPRRRPHRAGEWRHGAAPHLHASTGGALFPPLRSNLPTIRARLLLPFDE